MWRGFSRGVRRVRKTPRLPSCAGCVTDVRQSLLRLKNDRILRFFDLILRLFVNLNKLTLRLEKADTKKDSLTFPLAAACGGIRLGECMLAGERSWEKGLGCRGAHPGFSLGAGCQGCSGLLAGRRRAQMVVSSGCLLGCRGAARGACMHITFRYRKVFLGLFPPLGCKMWCPLAGHGERLVFQGGKNRKQFRTGSGAEKR